MPWKKEGIATIYIPVILPPPYNNIVEMPWKKEGIATSRALPPPSSLLAKVEMPWKKEGIATQLIPCRGSGVEKVEMPWKKEGIATWRWVSLYPFR